MTTEQRPQYIGLRHGKVRRNGRNPDEPADLDERRQEKKMATPVADLLEGPWRFTLDVDE